MKEFLSKFILIMIIAVVFVMAGVNILKMHLLRYDYLNIIEISYSDPQDMIYRDQQQTHKFKSTNITIIHDFTDNTNDIDIYNLNTTHMVYDIITGRYIIESIVTNYENGVFITFDYTNKK